MLLASRRCYHRLAVTTPPAPKCRAHRDEQHSAGQGGSTHQAATALEAWLRTCPSLTDLEAASAVPTAASHVSSSACACPQSPGAHLLCFVELRSCFLLHTDRHQEEGLHVTTPIAEQVRPVVQGRLPEMRCRGRSRLRTWEPSQKATWAPRRRGAGPHAAASTCAWAARPPSPPAAAARVGAPLDAPICCRSVTACAMP